MTGDDALHVFTLLVERDDDQVGRFEHLGWIIEVFEGLFHVFFRHDLLLRVEQEYSGLPRRDDIV